MWDHTFGLTPLSVAHFCQPQLSGYLSEICQSQVSEYLSDTHTSVFYNVMCVKGKSRQPLSFQVGTDVLRLILWTFSGEVVSPSSTMSRESLIQHHNQSCNVAIGRG